MFQILCWLECEIIVFVDNYSSYVCKYAITSATYLIILAYYHIDIAMLFCWELMYTKGNKSDCPNWSLSGWLNGNYISELHHIASHEHRNKNSFIERSDKTLFTFESYFTKLQKEKPILYKVHLQCC